MNDRFKPLGCRLAPEGLHLGNLVLKKDCSKIGGQMPHLGAGELIIILLIVIVLFGAGRVSKLGGELGSAIREFRKGINATDKDETTTNSESKP